MSSTRDGTGTPRPLRVSFLMADFSGGGAQRVMVHLAAALAARGVATELVVLSARGPVLELVPEGVPVVDLRRSSALRATGTIVRYLRRVRPDVLLATQDHMNVVAVIAGRLARTGTRIWIRQSNSPAHVWTRRPGLRRRITSLMSRLMLRHADRALALNEEMRDLMERAYGIPPDRLRVVRNPVLPHARGPVSERSANHPWLAVRSPEPVIVSVGRLTEPKDYATLVRAFARLRKQRPCRLVIFGDGEDRPDLERLAVDLGVGDAVDLPGWCADPGPEVSAADVFVLSSIWEGSPNALVEAMACGTTLVSTDCPTGPSEILDGGRLGILVPIRDPEALARAIERALDEPVDRETLRAASRRYELDPIIDELLTLLREEPRDSALRAERTAETD